MCLDDSEPEESGITSQADRVWKNNKTKRHVTESAIFRLLLPVCEGRRVGIKEQTIENIIVLVI